MSFDRGQGHNRRRLKIDHEVIMTSKSMASFIQTCFFRRSSKFLGDSDTSDRYFQKLQRHGRWTWFGTTCSPCSPKPFFNANIIFAAAAWRPFVMCVEFHGLVLFFCLLFVFPFTFCFCHVSYYITWGKHNSWTKISCGSSQHFAALERPRVLDLK